MVDADGFFGSACVAASSDGAEGLGLVAGLDLGLVAEGGGGCCGCEGGADGFDWTVIGACTCECVCEGLGFGLDTGKSEKSSESSSRMTNPCQQRKERIM